MTKKIFLSITFFLFLAGTSFAQQVDKSVDVNDTNLTDLQNVKLSSFIAKTDNGYEEKFKLYLDTSISVIKSLGETKLMLTAYKADGTILGRHIWCSTILADKSQETDNDTIRIVLDVNKKLDGAANYKLATIELDKTSSDKNSFNDPPGPATPCQ